jgi:hypothetical protein
VEENKMRALLIALAILYSVGASYARSVVIEPNGCPVDADSTSIVSAEAEAEAEDLNPWRDMATDIEPIIEVKLAKQPTTGKAFTWIRAETETGETFWRKEVTCAE